MATGIFKLRDQLLGLVQKAWTGSQTTSAVEYLVVAGGGGGGGANGAGGAGGLLQGIVSIPIGTPLTVTVGAGGNGGNGSSYTAGTNGQNSVFNNVTAIGGGGGAAVSSNGLSGGSGGGGGTPVTSVTTTAGGQGLFNQGNRGGSALFNSNYYPGGGGGGAGTVGLDSVSNAIAGNGGAGIASSILGTIYSWAGGGGGGVINSGTSGNGGVGGGGGGGALSGTVGAGGSGYNAGAAGTTGYGGSGGAGGANSGGGGGSGSYAGNNGGTGGSGICIISYSDIYNAPASFGGANSPTASTSGSGSVLFNGTSQYLSTPYAPNLNSTTTFTAECWFNATSLGSAAINIFGTLGGVGTSSLYIYNTGAVAFGIVGINEFTSSTGFVTTNVWYHIAIVRNGSNLNIYLNGTSIASTSSATTYCANSSNQILIGFSGASTYMQGYTSNFRFTNTAVYTTTFTPSTAPLTAISGTQLLLNTVSGAQFADRSTNSYTVTAVASPTWNQLSPFATGLGYKNRVYTWTASGTVTF